MEVTIAGVVLGIISGNAVGIVGNIGIVMRSVIIGGAIVVIIGGVSSVVASGINAHIHFILKSDYLYAFV